jgi:hypothetical protein
MISDNVEYVQYCGGHFEFHIGTKNVKFVENHPMNIHVQFGFNYSNAFFSETTNMIKAKLYMNVH